MKSLDEMFAMFQDYDHEHKWMNAEKPTFSFDEVERLMSSELLTQRISEITDEYDDEFYCKQGVNKDRMIWLRNLIEKMRYLARSIYFKEQRDEFSKWIKEEERIEEEKRAKVESIFKKMRMVDCDE